MVKYYLNKPLVAIHEKFLKVVCSDLSKCLFELLQLFPATYFITQNIFVMIIYFKAMHSACIGTLVLKFRSS